MANEALRPPAVADSVLFMEQYLTPMQEMYGDAAFQASANHFLHGKFWELQPPSSALVDPPAGIATIPVATLKEPVDGVIHTMEQVYEGCGVMEPVDVYVWATTKLTQIGLGLNAEVSSRASTKMEEFADAIRKRFPDRRIFLGHHFMPREADMNYVRFTKMDAVSHEVHAQGISPETAVVWVDADTPRIAYGALATMIRARDNREAHVIKPATMLFEPMPSEWRPLDERSDAEKVATVYALGRELLERTLEPTDARLYHEEHLTCFSIGDWWRTHGVDPRRVGDGYIGESEALLAGVRKYLDPNIPAVKYVEAEGSSSWRRFVDIASRGPAYLIPFQENDRGYVPHTLDMPEHVKSASLRVDPVVHSEINTMLQLMIERHPKPGYPFNEHAKRQLAELIVACAFVDDSPIGF